MKITATQLRRIIKETVEEYQQQLGSDDASQLLDSIGMMREAGLKESEMAMVIKGVVDASRAFTDKSALLDALDVADVDGPSAEIIARAFFGMRS